MSEKQKETEYSFGDFKTDLKSAFSAVKRSVSENVVHNYKVRGPALIVTGAGLFIFSVINPAIVIVAVGGGAGLVSYVAGSMDLAFKGW